MLCALQVLVCCVIVAQAQRVSGQFRATDTGQPLYNAVVHCEGVDISRNGRFACRLDVSGSFNVRVALPGYIGENNRRMRLIPMSASACSSN